MNHVISKTPTVRVITGLTDTALNNYPENIWLKNNGGHDLPDCEPKYLKWHDPETYDYIVEMSELEKSLVDANELELEKQSKIAEIKQHATNDIICEYPQYKQINASLGIYTEDEKNNIVSWIETNRTKYYAKIDTVNECETIECVQGVGWDD